MTGPLNCIYQCYDQLQFFWHPEHRFVPEPFFLRDVAETMSVGFLEELSNTENIMAMFSMRPTTWTAKKGCKEATLGGGKGGKQFLAPRSTVPSYIFHTLQNNTSY